jgi:hypothetical protein
MVAITPTPLNINQLLKHFNQESQTYGKELESFSYDTFSELFKKAQNNMVPYCIFGITESAYTKDLRNVKYIYQIYDAISLRAFVINAIIKEKETTDFSYDTASLRKDLKHYTILDPKNHCKIRKIYYIFANCFKIEKEVICSIQFKNIRFFSFFPLIKRLKVDESTFFDANNFHIPQAKSGDYEQISADQRLLAIKLLKQKMQDEAKICLFSVAKRRRLLKEADSHNIKKIPFKEILTITP